MTAKRYLFIDAYNVIHAVEDLRKALDKSLDSARDQLAERAVSIHDAEGIHTVLILDSSRQSLAVDHPYGKKTFEFVYAPARLSADGVIEQLLTRVAEPANVTVASNDAMVCESARVNRAVAISANDLLDWICACERRLIQDAERRRKLNEKAWRNGIELD
ncbi:MAG: putative RNA-binding protein with PIN domain [Lentimonas sp.]